MTRVWVFLSGMGCENSTSASEPRYGFLYVSSSLKGVDRAGCGYISCSGGREREKLKELQLRIARAVQIGTVFKGAGVVPSRALAHTRTLPLPPQQEW